MNPKKRTAATLILLVAAVLFAGACKKKIAAPAPPPPPPPPPAAPTVTLSAVPGTIDKGQSAKLTWSSENATKLDLQPGVGSVDSQGNRKVAPSKSTTYTLTVTGPGGTDSATARVTVVIPPPPPPPPVKEISEVELFDQNIKHAYFDFDSYTIRPDAGDALSKNAEFLRSRPGIRFTVEGHCDARGSEEYNLGLGDRRANSAKEYLVNLGIPEGRIRAVSYGKSRPSCTVNDEECWQENRRAHMRFGQ